MLGDFTLKGVIQKLVEKNKRLIISTSILSSIVNNGELTCHEREKAPIYAVELADRLLKELDKTNDSNP